MTGNLIFDGLLIGVFVMAGLSALILLFVDAPYGRHQREGWGPEIPPRLGWVLMESPASLVFLYFFLTGDNRTSLVAIWLLLLWQLHYVHRSFIYPFQIRVKQGSKMSLVVMLSGSTYCAINGYLNGAYITHYADHLNAEWLTDPRFVFGTVLFFVGYYINKRSDHILRNLRKNGAAGDSSKQSSKGYTIPEGFMFRYVSMPNYFGELVTWTGFAIASWSLAGVSFVVFTAANLVPRAIANHKWYLETFDNYPKERKAIIPGVL